MNINPRIAFDHPLSGRPQVSLILLDWSCRESFHMLDYLAQQDVPRESFEVVWIEYYDRAAPEIDRRLKESLKRGDPPPVDRWIVMDMPRTAYYHKHLMYNVGVIASRGDLVMIGDSDAMVTPGFVRALCNAFESEPGIVLHLDEVRSHSRRFYPFNYPAFEDVLREGCVNWKDGTTTGLRDTFDPVHALNYGACICARRADVIGIGGADEHIDYLGHICGPYDLTWRLVNFGRREVWHQSEFLYHVWHPGSDGDENYLGPHDGRNVSTVALQARRRRRVMPLVENTVIRRMRETGAEPDGGLEATLSAAMGDRPLTEWVIDDFKRTLSAGRAAWSQHRYAEAVTVWEPLLPRMQENVRFLSDIGWAYYYLGRYSNAASAFTRSVALDEDNPDALRGLGWTLSNQGCRREAVTAFARAIALSDPADRSPLQEAYRGRGWAYFHQSQLDEATADFVTALDLTRPDDIGSLQDLHRGLGWIGLKARQFERAAEHFRAAVGVLDEQGGPAYDDAQAGLERALAGVRAQKRAQPLEVLKAEVASRLRADLGWAYAERGDYGRARQAFREAAKLDRSNAQAQCGLGWAALRSGDIARALKAFNTVVEDCTEPVCLQKAYYGRGSAHYRRGNAPQAIKDFSRAINIADERHDTRAVQEIAAARSRAYFLTGNRERARKDLARTKGAHPWQFMIAMRAVQLRKRLGRVVKRTAR